MKANDARGLKGLAGKAPPNRITAGPTSNFLTQNRRRAAAELLEERSVVSQRRACRVVGRPRITQRFAPPEPSHERSKLLALLRTFLPTLGLAAGGYCRTQAGAGGSTTSGSTASGETRVCTSPTRGTRSRVTSAP